MSFSVAQVVVGLPVAGPFDYLIPPDMSGRISVGSRVGVPFASRFVVGYVVGLLPKSSFPRLKAIAKVLDDGAPTLSETALALCRRIAEYYGCSWGEAIETGLPVSLRSRKVVKISPADSPVPKGGTSAMRLCHAQGRDKIWDFLDGPIRAALREGRGVLILVPEVSQIEEVQKAAQKRFGVETAVLDRALKAADELTEWLKVREGRVPIVVGSRSAVFAPFSHLGLIVFFEEENPAYKQDQSPFYHAREAAVLRSELEHCRLIVVSSSPSAEFVWWARERHVPTDVLAPGRLGELKFLDLTNYKPGRGLRLSFPLQSAVDAAVQKKEKVLLFLNRRGFSTRTSCNACGFVLKCPRCGINMSYLYSKRKVVCHLCDQEADLPKVCPQCRGSYLRSTGGGVEKLESELSRIYPQAKVATFDRETRKIPADADIVVATQAVLRVLGRLTFDLIGVLDFESELNRLDYRSANRAFGLLIRLRQATAGQVVVQTANPSHYGLQAARTLDFEKFYDEELRIRRETGLPPFAHLIAVVVRGEKETQAFDHAKRIYQSLTAAKLRDCEILEPQADLIPQLRGKHRFTIMLKTPKVVATLQAALPILAGLKKSHKLICTVNVDP